MAYEMEVKDLPVQPAVSIRTTTTADGLREFFDDALPAVWGHLDGAGIAPAGPPFALFHEYEPEKVDLETGFPVSERIEAGGRVQPTELPGGRAVVTWHVGPYDGLADAHNAVRAYIEDEGLEPAGPSWEVYWTDPGEEPDPSKWRTEIIWPIKEPRSA
ncbi:MAG: GyrI-like domain-containing protein [Actinomycetota bacterium]|nr:GyrI-like domain-containing protein [Actinomycetota bacterium]